MWAEVNKVQAEGFQRNILKTILQLESTFFEMAQEDSKNTIVVCDRGTMDPSACECCVCRTVLTTSGFYFVVGEFMNVRFRSTVVSAYCIVCV